MSSASNDIERIIEELREELSSGVRVSSVLGKLSPPDLIDVLERLSSDERRQLAVLLPDNILVEIINKLPQQVLLDIVKVLGTQKLARIAIDLPPDELADLILKLPPLIRRSLLKELPLWKVEEVKPLLLYPPESAGGIMTTRIPVFHQEQRVGDAVKEFVVRSKFEEYETSRYIYVVDSEGKLVGLIDVKTFLTAPRDRKLKEIMNRSFVAVKAGMDQEEVVRLVVRYDLDEVPVVDENGKLLGAISADDLMDVIISEATEDIIMFGGIPKIREPYLTARVVELVRKRAIWLVFLYLTEAITISILSFYEKVLAAVIALSFFIPLLTDTGGNAGSQSATLVIRSLATGEIRFSDVPRIIVKETMTSLALGLILSPLAFTLSYLIAHSFNVSLVVSLSIILVVYVASMIGALLPLIASKIGIDPAVISAPLITTIADSIGLTLYFTLAILFLGLKI